MDRKNQSVDQKNEARIVQWLENIPVWTKPRIPHIEAQSYEWNLLNDMDKPNVDERDLALRCLSVEAGELMGRAADTVCTGAYDDIENTALRLRDPKDEDKLSVSDCSFDQVSTSSASHFSKARRSLRSTTASIPPSVATSISTSTPIPSSKVNATANALDPHTKLLIKKEIISCLQLLGLKDRKSFKFITGYNQVYEWASFKMVRVPLIALFIPFISV